MLFRSESSYQIFSNANKWGEITSTILTSVLASCIFYIISVLLPRIYNIRVKRDVILSYCSLLEDSVLDFINDIIQVELNLSNLEKISNDDYEKIRSSYYDYFEKNKQIAASHIILTKLLTRINLTLNLIYSLTSDSLREDLKQYLFQTIKISVLSYDSEMNVNKMSYINNISSVIKIHNLIYKFYK